MSHLENIIFSKKCCYVHCSLDSPQGQKWYQDRSVQVSSGQSVTPEVAQNNRRNRRVSFLCLLRIYKGIVQFLLFLSKAQEE